MGNNTGFLQKHENKKEFLEMILLFCQKLLVLLFDWTRILSPLIPEILIIGSPHSS